MKASRENLSKITTIRSTGDGKVVQVVQVVYDAEGGWSFGKSLPGLPHPVYETLVYRIVQWNFQYQSLLGAATLYIMDKPRAPD